ncbi:MAG: type 1 periplasmic binding fold superfamily protein [Gemmatimonadetes bacterium]|nr:type 1 periplasmic binding fold superfamily protein [Gemmatimonadota bacterium]MYG85760.1 type 1 periplasmic binding fold superfamily protein [Gemmatimonadota bacterium]MYJ90084.1 type 1 periplasmic binding fold superfamily protein [Gemmatimonadota bacterium]
MFRHHWNVLSILTAAVFVSAALTFGCADDDDASPTGPADPEEHEEDDHDDDHDHGPGEEELITTLALTITPSGGGSPIIVRFRDLDGEGGNAPVVDVLAVTAGTDYNGMVQVLNETETPPENITEEVEEEAEAHQFFFKTLGGFSAATVEYADKESDYVSNSGADHPVGLAFTLSVPDNAQNGQFQIILSHYDESPKDGVNRSDETDIDVTFEVLVR